jgi:hypothetical protein
MDEGAGLGGLAGRSAKKNGVFRKNVGIPDIYRWVWYRLLAGSGFTEENLLLT